MRLHMYHKKIGGCVVYGLLLRLIVLSLVVTFLFTGCASLTGLDKINTTMQNAVDSMDRAITALAQQSSDWRIVVQDLQENLTQDMQSTIRTEVSNLTREAVHSGGAELRCNAEFMRIKLERSLTKLRNDLAVNINKQIVKVKLFKKHIKLLTLIPEKPIEPFICTAIPSAVDLYLDPERRTKIDIFGFDLRSRPITVSVMTAGLMVPTVPRDKIDSRVFIEEMKKINLQTTVQPVQPNIALLAVKPPVQSDIISTSFKIVNATRRIRNDVSNALSIISDFHAVIDLTESGFDLLPNAQEIVLSWDNKIEAEIAVLTHVKVLKCEIVDRPFNEAGTMSLSFIPPVDNQYAAGDNDFDGHVCITFWIRLNVDPERKKIIASYYMDATESENGDFSQVSSDYTAAQGSGSFTLGSVGDNEKIVSFDVDSYMEHSYFDTNHDNDRFSFGGTQPVTKLVYVGDTNGDEAGTKTGVTIFFRRINVKVESCELK